MTASFRRSMLFALLAGATLATGCASPKYMVPAQPGPLPPPPADGANVVFVRPASYAGGMRFLVIDDKGRFLGETLGKTHFVARVAPGRHLFIAWGENTAALEATVDPGKTYYVHIQPTIGAFSAQVQLKGVRPGTEKWDELDGWLAKTKRLVLKGNTGQMYLDDRADKTDDRIRRGQEKFAGYSDAKLDDRILEPGDGV